MQPAPVVFAFHGSARPASASSGGSGCRTRSAAAHSSCTPTPRGSGTSKGRGTSTISRRCSTSSSVRTASTAPASSRSASASDKAFVRVTCEQELVVLAPLLRELRQLRPNGRADVGRGLRHASASRYGRITVPTSLPILVETRRNEWNARVTPVSVFLRSRHDPSRRATGRQPLPRWTPRVQVSSPALRNGKAGEGGLSRVWTSRSVTPGRGVPRCGAGPEWCRERFET